MNVFPLLIALVAGFLLGLAAAYLLRIIQAKTAQDLAEELFQVTEALRREERDAVIENVKASFGSLSLDALSKSTEEFLKLAQTKLASERDASVKELEAKKGLIDQQLRRVTTEMENVSTLMRSLEKDRVEKFGELSNQLKTASEQTAELTRVTNTLREALASTKARGQWGERMAEDILHRAGFVENINYVKQRMLEGAGTRPDFTFLLPDKLRLNMDVKFPLDNYLKFLEAAAETDKVRFRTAFLRDVKAKLKEVTTRDYINVDDNTVDCVILFIPNEQIYNYIHEQDPSLFEAGIRNKVIFCSPITLFAVLAVIRQAIDNFTLTQTSREILSLLGNFKKQWEEFLKKLEILGKRISETQKEYESLITTRRRQLEKPLDRIDALRIQQASPAPPEDDPDLPPV
ncbi:MAG: DNA recombination protein RmuC [Deltaproteobacteria bacterium]|nr:DNA recombination protein RmuC [Deltaproteobacteria bacterium]